MLDGQQDNRAVVMIGDRAVGELEPVMVVAEVGVNHDGDLVTALELVEAAAWAGADAVKLQTFSPAELAVEGAPLAPYQRERSSEAADQREMLERLCLAVEDLEAVARRSAELGLIFLSSPFDVPSAGLLERIGVPALKVASGELTNLPLLVALSERDLPLILSTGMATLAEIGEAVSAVRAGGSPLILLHCVSSYPTPPGQANLRSLDTLREAFRVPVGYSDHCLGLGASLAAVARDACLIERHITLDRARRGPDHAISLEPRELRELVTGIRDTEAMLGDGRKVAQAAELATRSLARRSIVAARALAEGETLTAAALTAKRPGHGLSPARLGELIGTRLARPLARDEMLTEAHLERRR